MLSVASIDQLLESDLDTASKIATGILPDVVAALDQPVPLLPDGADRAALRRYYTAVDAAVQTLTSRCLTATRKPMSLLL